MGSGRSEFNPHKPRPGIVEIIRETADKTLSQISHADLIQEGVISSFAPLLFNRQGNIPAVMAASVPRLRGRPITRVEGACGSGGLALVSAIKSVSSGMAHSVLVVGFEVQNTLKAVYGADVLARAGWSLDRKNGHAYYFPGKFSDRAGAYIKKLGETKVRTALAQWYVQAIENARTCPEAQEYENKCGDLMAQGMTPPSPQSFCEHLNYFDCSKVSDGAASLVVATKRGLEELGISRKDMVEVVGMGHAVDDITRDPDDLTQLSTTKTAISRALKMAGAGIQELALFESHDCFSITGLLALEAAGFCDMGEGADFVISGESKKSGTIPVNLTGGLIGHGHYTGGTGVRQAVDIYKQLLCKAGASQIEIPSYKPHGLMVSMGGNDKTVVALVLKKSQE
jgi:acetyl-CoA C-acetyltransferase/acetyl-CoA acyltransferase